MQILQFNNIKNINEEYKKIHFLFLDFMVRNHIFIYFNPSKIISELLKYESF